MNRADKRELDLLDRQIERIRADNDQLDLENGELRRQIALKSMLIWNLRIKIRQRLREGL